MNMSPINIAVIGCRMSPSLHGDAGKTIEI